MKHCVASYANRCSKGEYVVYHLTLKDGTEATLGCNVILNPVAPTKLSLQQCYGYANKTVDKTFAYELISEINLGISRGSDEKNN